MIGGLDAGLLDRRVALQKVTRTTTAKGDQGEAWATIATLWAEVREPTGREVFASEQRASQIDRVFMLRWRSDIKAAEHRLLYEGDLYDIVEVAEIGRRAGLLLRATVRRETV